MSAGEAIAGTPYRLLSKLGEGASGEVWLADHEALHRRVVIKRLRASISEDAKLRARFEREARIVAQLRHPSLVEVHDLRVDDDGKPFVVMPFVDGESLRAVISRGRVSVARAIAWTSQLLEALDVAHRAGVVHRDIKPENVLISRDDRAVLLDFGVAKVLARDLASAIAPDTLTAEGAIVGTPRTMAPELFFASEPSVASDLYAVGCVLHELLTGAPPFATRDLPALVRAHAFDPPPPIVGIDREVFSPIVARALEKEPSARWTSAIEMRDALALASASTSRSTTRDPTVATIADVEIAPSHSRARRLSTVVAIVIAAALLAFGALQGALLQRRSSTAAAGPIASAAASVSIAVERSTVPSASLSASITATASSAPVVSPSVRRTPIPRASADPKPSASIATEPGPMGRSSLIACSIAARARR